MIYDFTKEFTYDVGLDIDVKEIKSFIEKRYSEYETEADLIVKLKKVIKNDSDFKELLEDLDLTIKEFLYVMAFAYPEMFNHYLIKYVRKNYLFKAKSKFARL